jgi:hypothetical protein
MLLRCESLEPPMSQLGQTRSFGDVGSMSGLPESGQYISQLTADRLDVVHAAAVPLRADLGAAGRGETFEQARHRAGSPMFCDQLIATKRTPPVALIAGDEDSVSQLVGEAIERGLGHHIAAAPLADACARVGEYVGPPFLGHRLLRVRPGAALVCLTRLNHGDHEPRDIEKA